MIKYSTSFQFSAFGLLMEDRPTKVNDKNNFFPILKKRNY